jgi:hypothetical protein
MSLLQRIKNKIFKCNISSSVEYHARGFFIRKKVAYLFFTEKDIAYYFEREEGLHPNDNNYSLLICEIESREDKSIFELSSVIDNILKLTNKENQMQLMPSIFIENVIQENLTEIIVDKLNGTTQIFTHVYTIISPAGSARKNL